MINLIKLIEKGDKLDIQSIKAFVQVATFGNYTKAANEMNYAQSTVTMQLKRLEEELGYPLFEKIGRRNYLTSQGKVFLSYANRILSLFQEASSISDDPKAMKGTVRVGALESIVFSRVLPKLGVYRSEYPNSEITIKIAESTELLNMLRENRIDIAWVAGERIKDSSFECLLLKEEQLSFVASSKHPLANKKPSVEEILSYPVISTEASGYCYFKLHEIASAHSVELSHAVTVESIHGVSQLLHDGISVAFLPSNAISDVELKIIETSILPQIRYSQMLVLGNKWRSPLIKGFADIMDY